MVMEYLVWWVSARDIWVIDPDRITIEFPDMPAYIVSEFRSMAGRNGRGRLWVAPEIRVEEITWRDDSLAARYADPDPDISKMTAGGIVIHVSDVHHVRKLPGIITDLEMNLV